MREGNFDRELILVADDDEDILALVGLRLERAGYEVVTARDGVEALERFESGRFDLVITDRAMPQMGGEALAATLAEREPDLPVIMLTGFGELMQAAEEQPRGVDLVLAKPITMRRLREVLANIVAPDD
jgi:CheY-like chemotaxis protein